MLRQLKFALAAIVLTPSAAPAQNDGLASLDALINADGAEDWAICTLASADLGEGVSDPAEKTLRDRETEMLLEVAVVRFMQQQGLTLEQAKDRFTAVITTRAPLYEDGSGTDIIDRGKCILAGMVSAGGDEIEPRLVAAYEALPPIAPAAPAAPAAPVAPAGPAAPAAPATPAPPHATGQTAPDNTFYSAAMGEGGALNVVSYYIAPDGTLVGHWSYNDAASAMYGENAIPVMRGQGLAGSYTTSGKAWTGDYSGRLEITELHEIEAPVLLYRMVWDDGDLNGYGLWLGADTLVATFGPAGLGQFFRRDGGDGWDLYLVEDGGSEPVLSQFRFAGGHFEGGHAVLGGENADQPLGTASFSRDGAGVVRIAMPGGETVIAVCNRVSIMGC